MNDLGNDDDTELWLDDEKTHKFQTNKNTHINTRYQGTRVVGGMLTILKAGYI